MRFPALPLTLCDHGSLTSLLNALGFLSSKFNANYGYDNQTGLRERGISLIHVNHLTDYLVQSPCWTHTGLEDFYYSHIKRFLNRVSLE